MNHFKIDAAPVIKINMWEQKLDEVFIRGLRTPIYLSDMLEACQHNKIKDIENYKKTEKDRVKMIENKEHRRKLLGITGKQKEGKGIHYKS